MTPRIAALVPMRHHSERVAGKNYRPLDGRPLFHWVVESLLECPRIAEVAIDTDSAIILDDAARHFPTVRLLERPAELRDGNIPMNDILLRDVELVPADLYLQTHSTNPMLRAATITDALDRFLTAGPRYDSLFSVTRLQSRLWDGTGRAINHDPDVLLRTQDLPPVLEENSCLYLFDASTLRARRNRIGLRPLLYEIDKIEAWDIDEEADFVIAELLHSRRGAR